MPNKYKREATLRGKCECCGQGEYIILHVTDYGNICAWCLNDIYGSEDYLEYDNLIESFGEEQASYKKKLHCKMKELHKNKN